MIIFTLSVLGVLLALWLIAGILVDCGTYRWVKDDSRFGPPPVIHFAYRPKDAGWVRLEASIRGRCFYVTWGHGR